MKIAIVVDQLLPGGVQKMAIEQTRHLNQLGHQARLIILMRKNFSSEYASMLQGIPYQFLSDLYPRPFRTSIKFPLFSFFSTLHLLSPILAPRYFNSPITKNQKLKTKNTPRSSPLRNPSLALPPGRNSKPYDLIISHGTTTCLTTQAIYRHHSIPYLAIIHDPISYILTKVYGQTWLKTFFPLLIPLANYLEKSFIHDALDTILISTVHQDHFLSHYGIHPQVIPLGVQVSPRLPSTRGKTVISFGRWETEKHPEFILQVASQLPNLEFCIAGSWTNPADLDKFRKLVLSYPNVKLIPHYTDQELDRLCQQSFVWIYPNFESFSLAALEAAAHGLPIVIPSGSGISELLEDQSEAFFPVKNDSKIYANIIKYLYKHPKIANQIGKQASEKIKTHYSWKNHTQKLLAIISRHCQPHQILAFELGHVSHEGLAGGDRLLEEMSHFLPSTINLTVITTKQGASHWQTCQPVSRLENLPQTFWDLKPDPYSVFLAYFARIIRATRRSLSIPFISHPILYSSTNILTDIAPAYLYKLFRPATIWIARIHHLIPSPSQRPGRLVVNFVSYTMQLIALNMIKSRANITISLNPNLTTQLTSLGFSRSKLTTIGAGINLKKIQSIHAHRRQYTAIYLGRLHPAKGIDDLIPICSSVIKKYPQFQIAVIGAGQPEQLRHFKSQINHANLSKHLHILGYLPESTVYSYLKSAKIFLAPDHEAGFGIAIAEAMAAGLPVVGYQLPIFGSVFKHGFLTSPLGDTHGFAQQIINLLSDSQLYRQIHLSALQQANQHSWHNTATKFSRLIKQISSTNNHTTT